MSEQQDSQRESSDSVRTHRDLMPKDLCPHLMMKQILTHALDQETFDDRDWPGDGYYWCQITLCDVGPDDEIVHPGSCRRGRPCHVELDLS
ncbi:MAG: hypothetical protein ACE5F1_17395 [Planctomycetota bacterium]